MGDAYDEEIKKRWRDKARQDEIDAHKRMNDEANVRWRKLGEQPPPKIWTPSGKSGNDQGSSGGSSSWVWVGIGIVALIVLL